MLIVVLFCTIGLAFGGDGSGYNYPKPTISFDEGVCPPGTNGMFPHCDNLPPSEEIHKCSTGYSGQYPDCKKDTVERPKHCRPHAEDTLLNGITVPCPSGFTGTFPNCEETTNRPANSSNGYLPPPPPTGRCTLDWEQFKTTFDKTYADSQEELDRQQIFLQNQQIIASHNLQFEQGLETYSLCMNKFGDWTHNEYFSINGIDICDEPVIDDQYLYDSSDDENSDGSDSSVDNESVDNESVDSDSDDGGSSQGGTSQGRNLAKKQGGKSVISGGNVKLPDIKDWRDEGAVTPVKDQLLCASCWAFSAVGALEGQFFMKNKKLTSFSEQQLVDCSRGYSNNGCNTGFMTNAFLYTQKNGILTEDEYPYEGQDNQCHASPNAVKNEKFFKVIPKGNEEALKKAIGTVGPVAVGLDALNKKFQFFNEGVYMNPDCNPERISHAVLAVGYGFDERTGLDYWLIKNSYGTTWGEGGYGKVARNKNNHCGITNLASFPII